uniref:Leucine rich immune protein (Coil-less) n=1 Tax=Anopheles culicifacies TaxID=139723 RepID=A0A182MQZ3_9DIPT
MHTSPHHVSRETKVRASRPSNHLTAGHYKRHCTAASDFAVLPFDVFPTTKHVCNRRADEAGSYHFLVSSGGLDWVESYFYYFLRAGCPAKSNEKLINTYTDVPYDVEILDLSINIISSIENDNFERYDNLVKLFLSENSIQTISLDAFANQRRLTTLDLSYNRLEHLNEQLFERNLALFLHLSNCRIPHIFDSMFIDLPNLKSLDLSENIMNSLATMPFAHLRKLTTINLIDNRWNCKTEDVRNTCFPISVFRIHALNE